MMLVEVGSGLGIGLFYVGPHALHVSATIAGSAACADIPATTSSAAIAFMLKPPLVA